MKMQDIIDNYCRLYGVTMPEIDVTETQYFVAISPDGASVLYKHHSQNLLGRIVGGAMKRGTVLYVRNGWVTPLTWETWKQTWAKFFTSKPHKTAPVPNRERMYKSEIFETMQTKRSPKKPHKGGFEQTYNANISLNRLSHPLSGMRVESL